MSIDLGSYKAFMKVRPYAAMVLLQLGFAGMHVTSVFTLKDGMNQSVLVVYRNIVAAAVMTPFALWFERKERPTMTTIIFFKIMALALLQAVLDQNFYYMGAKMTSASFVAAIENMNPAITFLLALFLRVEKFSTKGRRSKAKLIGPILTFCGALLMIMYKGPILEFIWARGRGAQIASRAHEAAAQHATGNLKLVKGTLLILASCLSWSFFLILQSNTLKSYPAKLSVTSSVCCMGAVMNTLVALVIERGKFGPLVIGWDKRLFAPIYSGVVCSGLSYYILGMVMSEKGPVFAGAFTPLSLIMTFIMGSIILAESINLGMAIGSVIMLIGLYSLLWGKSTEDHVSSMQSTNGGDKAEPGLPVAAPNIAERASIENRTIINIDNI